MSAAKEPKSKQKKESAAEATRALFKGEPALIAKALEGLVTKPAFISYSDHSVQPNLGLKTSSEPPLGSYPNPRTSSGAIHAPKVNG